MTTPLTARNQQQRPLPLYALIKATLREQILDGSYGEHARLPSETELMVEYGVSRITVRQALSDLQNEADLQGAG